MLAFQIENIDSIVSVYGLLPGLAAKYKIHFESLKTGRKSKIYLFLNAGALLYITCVTPI
jgi:hypothetical protein